MNFSRALIRSIRDYKRYSSQTGVIPSFLRRYASIRHLVLSILTSSDISKHADISDDLKLPHPTGVVMHRDVIIGAGCMIMHQVTIGQLADGGVPRIGTGVYIGAGAKVLGKISIGNGARIGANAVVLVDVPQNSTAVGIPAVIKPSKN